MALKTDELDSLLGTARYGTVGPGQGPEGVSVAARGRAAAPAPPQVIHTREHFVHVERVPERTHVIERVPLAPISLTVDLRALLGELRSLRATLDTLQEAVETLQTRRVTRRVLRDRDGLITGSVEEPATP